MLWALLAGGAYLAGWEYYSTPAPGRAIRPDHSVFGPRGAFGFAAAAMGWAMILTGVVIYAIQKKRGPDSIGLSSRFGVHAFLCTLGCYFVILHTGFAFTGGASLLSWSVLAMAVSVGSGAYLMGWLPESTDGRKVPTSVLAERRQQLLQRLWTMTDTAPDRIEYLLDHEIPVGEFGPVRALEISLRYRWRTRLRSRRLRAAVAILGVRDGAVPEAVEIVEKQAHVQSFLQLGTPFSLLARYWRAIHIPLGLVVSVVLAIRLVAIVSGGAS
ncbi:MAG: hypothetical protein ACR2QM_19445 [Longimicrobiales bacterium]